MLLPVDFLSGKFKKLQYGFTFSADGVGQNDRLAMKWLFSYYEVQCSCHELEIYIYKASILMTFKVFSKESE